MDRPHGAFKTIGEYIAACPAGVQKTLRGLRKTIRGAAPGAREVISYQMPAFWLEGNLVYFAVFKNHIGFFPTAGGVAAFKKELAIYPGSKGTVRFPLDRPLPLALITKIVKFRVAENLRKAEAKRNKKK
jgi:uncharacterized protein YdhG (YjbR/CyaY superfamily)